MPDYTKQILSLFTDLESDSQLTGSRVLHLMALLRQLLEKDGLKKHYVQLGMYCDWMLHPKLDRSRIAFEILDSLSTEFASTEPKQYNDVVNEIIGLQKLRRELLDLCALFSFPSILFESKSNWRSFVGLLASLLIDKPLFRKAEKTIPIPRKPATYATSLRLGTPQDNPALRNAQTDPAGRRTTDETVFWLVETNKGVTVIGLFVIPESKSAFEIL